VRLWDGVTDTLVGGEYEELGSVVAKLGEAEGAVDGKMQKFGAGLEIATWSHGKHYLRVGVQLPQFSRRAVEKRSSRHLYKSRATVSISECGPSVGRGAGSDHMHGEHAVWAILLFKLL
jgi:hypothetical protein